MPTISFIQPKGGTGKSTSALVLATELAKRARVIVIDSDPNEPIARWRDRGGQAPNLEVIRHTDEDTILDVIEEAAQRAPFVIIDTEGTANFAAAKAITASDFVIVPSQGSALDLDNAAKAIKFIKDAGRMAGRAIPHAVLFTRVSAAIRSRGMKAAEQQLADHGIDVFEVQIVEREAFKAMFSFNTTLEKLDTNEVSGVDKAWFNTKAFTGEVIRRLKAIEGGAASAEREVA